MKVCGSTAGMVPTQERYAIRVGLVGFRKKVDGLIHTVGA